MPHAVRWAINAIAYAVQGGLQRDCSDHAHVGVHGGLRWAVQFKVARSCMQQMVLPRTPTCVPQESEQRVLDGSPLPWCVETTRIEFGWGVHGALGWTQTHPNLKAELRRQGRPFLFHEDCNVSLCIQQRPSQDANLQSTELDLKFCLTG